MAARALHSHDLSDLQGQLLRLAELVDRAIISALWSFRNSNIDEARRVVAGDRGIATLRDDIEQATHRLLAGRQALLGSDLRAASAMLFLAAEIERIGDYAQGIATVTIRGAGLPVLEPPPVVHQMSHLAREMFQQAIRAVVTLDVSAARRLYQMDGVVDRYYRDVLQTSLTTMRMRPEQSEQATYQLWVAHNLERTADRAVNIAERVGFIATGTPTSRQRYRDAAMLGVMPPGSRGAEQI